MAIGDKYIDLTHYLQNKNEEKIKLTFSEIKHILGYLPESSYKYHAAWANTESHSISFGWMNAGYQTSAVDLPNQTVTFIKKSALHANPLIEKEHLFRSDAVLNHALPDVEYALSQIKKFYSDILNDEYARYRSWEHCYAYFSNNRNNNGEQIKDIMCLHLAFYFASWGMYRGSAFLLQKDYKIHRLIIEIVLNKKYIELWNLHIYQIQDEAIRNKIFEAEGEIIGAYRKIVKGFDSERNASQTLVTKILLGTFGCVPAYDRYLKRGLSAYNMQQTLSHKSLLQLVDFYVNCETQLEKLRKGINANGIEYPHTKIIDMCFWQIGYDLDNIRHT